MTARASGDGSIDRSGIVDAHLHMIAAPLMAEWERATGADAGEVRAKIEEGRRRRGGPAPGEIELPDVPAEEMARRWETTLLEQGVEQGVFMSFTPRSEYFRAFASARPDRIFACCTLDPREEGSAELVAREIEAGSVGVKLYPVNQAYALSDERTRPFFAAVRELDVPVCIHYGVSVDGRADLRFADPTDLSPVARDFPEVPFVIAHFGAGYLREVLALSYQCPNVHVDTSGTNNWLKVMPYCQTLSEVFEICLDALGPQRVLFGTDSGAVPAGYRDWILAEQLAIIDALGLAEPDRRAVIADNARRLYRLPLVGAQEPTAGTG